MTDFHSIHPALAAALRKKGYSVLTPVQEAVVAPKLRDVDVLVSAQTGSGKTVAFGMSLAPTLLGKAEQFLPADHPLAVVIAPTRELALQVKRELDWLYREAQAKLVSCVGGMDMRDERRALARGAHIVVGTPGRLCDHIKRGSLDMSALKAVVLDEADEMLKMGFREELELILGAAPDVRRTLMFSATVPQAIIGITQKYQRNAVRVNTAAGAKQHLDIEYRILSVTPSDKENAIINVLRYYDAKNAIVFGDTRVAVNRMTSRFNNRRFSVVALSGELSQKERSHALQALRDGRAKVCIATDVAARGLDLPDLELVIHADIPKNKETLLHRSGRTGRAGRKGVSALIVPHSGRRRIERLLKEAKITAEWAAPPSAGDVIDRDNGRLIADLVLTEPVTEEERIMVARMLKAHDPEHLATCYIRQYRAGRSAPEELIGADEIYDPSLDGGRRERKPRSRNDFDNGVWFLLNLGRKQKAEPRWILPMLCKSGDLKKSEIGSIKITERQTFIEIAPQGVDRFEQAIGPQGKIEKAITARRIDGQPDFSENSRGARPPVKRERSRNKDKDRKGKGHNDKSAKTPRPPDDNNARSPYRTKTAAKAAAKDVGTATAVLHGAVPDYSKTGKKPHKKKLARARKRAEQAGEGHSKTGSDKTKSGKSGGQHPPKRRVKPKSTGAVKQGGATFKGKKRR